MQKTDLPYYVTNFFTVYLPGQKNLSKNTIASYAVTFKLFFTFCRDNKDIQPERLKLPMINEALVTEFLDWLESERNCSVTTRNQRLVSLHSFFRFILMKEPAYMDTIIRILEIPYKKTPKTVVPYLSEEQMKILFSSEKSTNGMRFTSFGLFSGKLSPVIMTKQKSGWFAAMLFFLYNKAKK